MLIILTCLYSYGEQTMSGMLYNVGLKKFLKSTKDMVIRRGMKGLRKEKYMIYPNLPDIILCILSRNLKPHQSEVTEKIYFHFSLIIYRPCKSLALSKIRS